MNTFYRPFLLLIALLALGQGLRAQDSARWTLDQCMLYAIENCQTRHIQDAQNKIYDYNYQEAIASLLPSLRATASGSMNFGRGLDGETNTYTNINSLGSNFGVESSVVLFSGFSRIMQARVARTNQTLGRTQLQQTQDDIALKVMERYYNTLYYQQTVKLAEQQYEASTQQLAQMLRMEQLGVKSDADVAEFEAQQAADKLLTIRNRNLHLLEMIRLKEQMNFPLSEELTLADSSLYLPVAGTLQSASDIYQQALYYLPEALAAEYKVQMQQQQYTQAIGQLMPTVSAFGGVSTGFSRLMNDEPYTPFPEQFRERRGEYVGLSLSIPIFEGLSRSSGMRRAKQQVKIAEQERSLTLRVLYSEIEQAVADMNGQAEEYTQAQKQWKAKNLAHLQNIRKYEQGLISALELNTSANRLLQAGIEQANALYQFQLKQRLVNFYKGQPLVTN